MGAGNPQLKSFDNDRFEPTTYFLDLGGDFDEYREDSENDELDDDTIYDMINQDSEMCFDNLIESLCAELNMTGVIKGSDNYYHDELSYAFRDHGMIMTEGENCYVITETSSEYSHMPIASPCPK